MGRGNGSRRPADSTASASAPATGPRLAALSRLSAPQWRCVSEVLEAAESLRGDKICFEVTSELSRRLGWAQESGFFDDGRTRDGHYWNRLSDGTIVDPTYDQFDPDALDPVRVVPPEDPAQSEYRRDPSSV